MLDICQGNRSWRGSRGRAGKGHARAAGTVLAAIAATGLYLASPAAASAAQPPAAVPTTTPQAGTALAWGDNTFGQLGTGTTGGISSTPVAVHLPTGMQVTAVAASSAFSLALTSAGSVLAWGDNSYGELGDGRTASSSTPVPVDLPAGTHVTAIAAGSGFSLALTSTGGVLAWGYNNFGQLGNDRTASSSTPVPVDLPAGTHVTAIAAGDMGGLALTSTGGVLAWGYNTSRQLGNGSTATDSLIPVPVDLPAGVHVTAIAGGDFFSLALTSTGNVLAWGANGNGELGTGGTGGVKSTPVTVHLPAGVTVTAVAAGVDYGLALTSAGRVLAWGDNYYDELGTGTTTVDSPAPVPVDLPTGTQVTAVTAGYDHSLALTSAGRVLAWGTNGSGQLGDHGTANSPVPIPVDLPAGTSVTAVSAGGDNSLAVAVHTSC
jgi:alpha-tubulin suppressor-like RCC1 family protein